MREKIMLLGGGKNPNSIGPSCTVATVKAGKKYINVAVDMGKGFPNDGQIWPALSRLRDEKLNAVVITHIHGDHSGGLAYAVAQGYLADDACIFMSPQTAALILDDLADGLQIDEREGRDSFYDRRHIREVEKRIRVIERPGEIQIYDNAEAFVWQMGHVGGAMSVTLMSEAGPVGFTGDFCLADLMHTKRALLPSQGWPQKWIWNRVAGTDFTYGKGVRKSLRLERTRLTADVRDELRRGHIVIIPAFGNGRSQEVALVLAQAGIEVYLDGSARKKYKALAEHRWTQRDGILPLLGARGSLVREIENEAHREQLIYSRKPVVVVTTSGMGDFGPVVWYEEELLPEPRASFFFVSYLSPDSTGAMLVRHADGEGRYLILEQNGRKKRIDVRARVEQYGLGGHSDFDEDMLFFADMVRCRNGEPLDSMLFTHATYDTQLHAVEQYEGIAHERIFGQCGTEVDLTKRTGRRSKGSTAALRAIEERIEILQDRINRREQGEGIEIAEEITDEPIAFRKALVPVEFDFYK